MEQRHAEMVFKKFIYTTPTNGVLSILKPLVKLSFSKNISSKY